MQIKYNNGIPRTSYNDEEHWKKLWRKTLMLTLAKQKPSFVQRGFIEIESYFNNRLCQNPGSDSQIESRLEEINRTVFRSPRGVRGMFVDFNNFRIHNHDTNSGYEIANLMETITGLSLHDKDWIQENYPGLHAFGKYAEQQIKSQE